MKKNVITCDENKLRQLYELAGICEGDCNIDSCKCIYLITLIEEQFNIEIPAEYFHESLLSNSKEVSEIINALQKVGGTRKNEKNSKRFF